MGRKKAAKVSFNKDRKHHLKTFNTGHSWTQREDAAPEPAQQASENLSVSARKLPLSPPRKAPTEGVDRATCQEVQGNYITDLSLLEEGLSPAAVCAGCKSGQLRIFEMPAERYGWAASLVRKCDNEDCSAPPQTVNTSRKTGRVFDVNRLCVTAMSAIGRGHTHAVKFSAFMNMQAPFTTTPYATHTKDIAAATDVLVDDNFKDAALEVKKLKMELVQEEQNQSDEILAAREVDCGVTIDGSWLHRSGSRHGFVTVISVDTGKVLDRHYMCSVCPQCSR